MMLGHGRNQASHGAQCDVLDVDSVGLDGLRKSFHPPIHVEVDGVG